MTSSDLIGVWSYYAADEPQGRSYFHITEDGFFLGTLYNPWNLKRQCFWRWLELEDGCTLHLFDERGTFARYYLLLEGDQLVIVHRSGHVNLCAPIASAIVPDWFTEGVAQIRPALPWRPPTPASA